MILYQIWCKHVYVSGGFCECEDEPTQLIFTTLEKARSKIPKTIIVEKMVHVNITLGRLKLNKKLWHG